MLKLVLQKQVLVRIILLLAVVLLIGFQGFHHHSGDDSNCIWANIHFNLLLLTTLFYQTFLVAFFANKTHSISNWNIRYKILLIPELLNLPPPMLP